MKNKIIPRKHIPVKLPINSTLILLLLLKVYEAPTWMWVVSGIYTILLLLITLIKATKEVETPIKFE